MSDPSQAMLSESVEDNPLPPVMPPPVAYIELIMNNGVNHSDPPVREGHLYLRMYHLLLMGSMR